MCQVGLLGCNPNISNCADYARFCDTGAGPWMLSPLVDGIHERTTSSGGCPGLPSFAVISIMTQSNLQRKGFISSSSPSEMETKAGAYSRNHEGTLLTSTLSNFCSARSPRQPQTGNLPAETPISLGYLTDNGSYLGEETK